MNRGKNVRLKKMNIIQKWIFAQPLVEHPAGDLGCPVVEPAEEGEDEPAHDRVVEVRKHEEAPVHGDVDRDVGQEHAGDAADQEVEEHAQGEQHRHLETDLRFPQRPEADQEDEAGRDRDELGREHEQRPHVRVDPALEQVVLPDEERQQRHAHHAGRSRPGSRRGVCGMKTGRISTTIPNPGNAMM